MVVPITAVEDRLAWTKAEVKPLLGIVTTDYDALLDLAVPSAMQAADLFMQNPFLAINTELDFNELNRTELEEWEIDILTSLTTVFSDRIPGLPAYIYNSNPSSPDAADVLAIPALVQLGVLEWVRGFMQIQGRPTGVRFESPGAGISRTYVDIDEMNSAVEKSYWAQYKMEIF